MIGYTDRWVWGVSSPAWHNALKHHYQHNPHHPQHSHHTDINNTKNKTNNDTKTNINTHTKLEEGDLHPKHTQCTSTKMCSSHLEESVLDMVACHWERRQGGREDATARDIADFGGDFLERYTKEDRHIVESLLDLVIHSNL